MRTSGVWTLLNRPFDWDKGRQAAVRFARFSDEPAVLLAATTLVTDHVYEELMHAAIA